MVYKMTGKKYNTTLETAFDIFFFQHHFLTGNTFSAKKF